MRLLALRREFTKETVPSALAGIPLDSQKERLRASLSAPRWLAGCNRTGQHKSY